MLVQQVDAVRAQAAQRFLHDATDALRPAVQPAAGLRVREAELGRDHDLVPDRLQRLAQEVLVGAGAVHLGRVEEGDTAFERGADQPDGLLPVRGRPVAEAQSHAAQAQCRDAQAASPEFTCVHRSPYCARRAEMIFTGSASICPCMCSLRASFERGSRIIRRTTGMPDTTRPNTANPGSPPSGTPS